MELTDTQNAALKLFGYEFGITNGGDPAIFTSPRLKDKMRWALVRYREDRWIPTRHIQGHDVVRIMSILHETD